MKYEEMRDLIKDIPCKNRLVGDLSIYDINNFIQDKNIDTIYISKRLFKNITYITNKILIGNEFNDVLYYMSTSSLDTNRLLVLLKKMLGGFDFKTNKFYCIDGNEIKANILEGDNFNREIFLIRDNNVIGYIDTCDTYY